MQAGQNRASAEVSNAVADAHRREWAFVLASTVRVTRDLDLAQECVQDAYAQALTSWTWRGIPERPGAWLTTAARRRALDAIRRQSTLERKLPLLIDKDEPEPVGDGFPDDRLRLICTCCHPALSQPAQVALTLRLVCGLTTAEVAHAFLVSEPTMAARITRAKRKISAARIPYRVPPPSELPARIGSVLTVVHLLFTTGHTAPTGGELVRVDLVERAIDLARMLHELLAGEAGVTGLLALFLLTDSRRATRLDDSGQLVLLADQDRTRWNRQAIEEGCALAKQALVGCPPRFALEAAIAAVHAEAPTWEQTDWPEIVGLYDALLASWPSPVVALNRAVAVSFAAGPATGLVELDKLGSEPRLASYAYLPAARADALRRLGRTQQARIAYEEALLLTDNDIERTYLAGRLAALS